MGITPLINSLNRSYSLFETEDIISRLNSYINEMCWLKNINPFTDPVEGKYVSIPWELYRLRIALTSKSKSCNIPSINLLLTKLNIIIKNYKSFIRFKFGNMTFV